MKKLLVLLIPVVFFFVSCDKEVATVTGCTDNTALNYNPDATEENGSCEYVEEFLLGEWLLIMDIVNDYTCRSYCESNLCGEQYYIQPPSEMCLYYTFNEDGSGWMQSYSNDPTPASWELINGQLTFSTELFNPGDEKDNPTGGETVAYSLIDINISSNMIVLARVLDEVFYIEDDSESFLLRSHFVKIQ